MTFGGAGLTSAVARSRLIDKLRREQLAGEEVLSVMQSIPRHAFVDEAISHRAYDNTVLPIGHRQTISQPAVVAMMTEAVSGVEHRGKILEIGTGCGYQTAILAQLFGEVYTIERIQPLLTRTRQLLAELNINNVNSKLDDGHLGWEDCAPFDAIVGTAAADEIPQPLLDQLGIGGRFVLPVAESGLDTQDLIQMERFEEGFVRKSLCTVRFVPMLQGTVT